MFKIKGKYTEAKFFASEYDNKVIGQVQEICNQQILKDCAVSIMPDAHIGDGISIGTVIKIKDKIKAEYVSCDVGCGVLAIKIDSHNIDFEKLDKFIINNIPSGMELHNKALYTFDKKKDLHCMGYIKHPQLIDNYLMTLGGGNHFLEVDKDENDDYWIIVHTGSRNLGIQIEKFYRNLAFKYQNGYKEERENNLKIKMNEYKQQGKSREVGNMMKQYYKDYPETIYSSFQCYLYDEFYDMYIHDMKIVQEFASLNRQYILNTIMEYMNWIEIDRVESVHNYIDIENMILRKGAISAQKGEKLIIPLSMADGSIIGIGKGNEDYIYSAPHGAGRKMSRNEAKENLSMKEFEDKMKDVYSTSVCQSTLDESPMAYKNADTIILDIEDTVDIILRLKPVYNFKAH